MINLLCGSLQVAIQQSMPLFFNFMSSKTFPTKTVGR